jgi:hypothetical protein
MSSGITPEEQAEWDAQDRARDEWEAANPHWRNPHLHGIWLASKAATEAVAKIEKMQLRFAEVGERIRVYLQEHPTNG